MPLTPGATVLNKYRIVKQIGQGGMATVWLAQEPAFGNRQVALKELRADLPAMDLPDAQRRFHQEVEVCAALEAVKAPNVVRTHTVEPYEGSLLLVMDYMAGGDLAERIKQSPQGMPVEEALAVARRVLAALQAAHEHPLEIVHRDVKPSNILFDGNGHAQLADFGLAQLAGVSGRSQLTGAAHPGSPLYMAPEQARSNDYLTPAADVYALGCVLFEMLTGKRCKRMRPGTPAEVAEWLEGVLAKALAEDPYDRYAEAGEMLAELAQEHAIPVARDTVPIADYPDSPTPQSPSHTSAPTPSIAQSPGHTQAAQPVGQITASPPRDSLPRDSVATPHKRGLSRRRWILVVLVLMALALAAPWFQAQTSRPRSTVPAPAVDETDIGFNPVDGAGYVRVPAGRFIMGSDDGGDDERPVHEVYLAEFWIMQTEVTNALYAKCVRVGECSEPDNERWNQADYADHPVVDISWYDAQDYAKWVGGRLPTEAEWEIACRGTEALTYPWGNAQPSSRLLNYDRNIDGTVAVGRYPSGGSPYGALDMAGNVWEWTADWYDPDYYANSPTENPHGPVSGDGRVVRGGAFYNNASYVRCAFRIRGDPYVQSYGFGFRVVSSGL